MTKTTFEESAGRLFSMVESAPVNIMCADKQGVIQYLNPKSVEALTTLEDILPVAVDQVHGNSFDVFHKNPAFQRDLIKDASKLPIASQIQLGDHTLDLLVTAMRDDSGTYLGPMVVWEVITAKLEREDDVARIESMMEGAPINIMCADKKGVIQYMNPASSTTLKTLQGTLPVPVEKIVGGSYDIFHSNPAHQRNVVKDDSKLPMNSQIQLGDDTIDLLVSPMRNANGEYIGPMVTWEVITQRLENERSLAAAQQRERDQAEELRRKVDSMLTVVEAAADGDLTQTVSFEGDDAISQMANGLTRLLGGLRESIAGIAENAGTLATSSEGLMAVSQEMSASSEETSVQANVVAKASREVDENVQTVAAGTEELSASIQEISGSAQTAANVAREAVKVAGETNAKISKLSDSSAEIGQVIKVITSIAQQTNLLALNATIEAARAGEAGKSFAVVANEVKELAKATASATEDISSKIVAIQADTSESVLAIEKISAIIGTINDTQNSIASAVEEQAATTSDMAQNVSNANNSTAAIVSNIEGVAQAAGETSKGAAGVMTAAGDLSGMAAQLEQLVTRFTF